MYNGVPYDEQNIRQSNIHAFFHFAKYVEITIAVLFSYKFIHYTFILFNAHILNVIVYIKKKTIQNTLGWSEEHAAQALPLFTDGMIYCMFFLYVYLTCNMIISIVHVYTKIKRDLFFQRGTYLRLYDRQMRSNV